MKRSLVSVVLFAVLLMVTGATSAQDPVTVRIGWAGSPDTLNPGTAVLSEAYTLFELVYDSMYQLQPDGTYTFEVESRQGDSILDTQPVAAYVPVLEARYQNGATMLVMPGGLMVDSASVTGLRRPTD